MSRQLNSILKNVPIPLMRELKKYRTKNSIHSLRWKARQPIEGQKWGWGGSLKMENAQSADLYVDARSREIDDLYARKYHLERVNRELKERLESYKCRAELWDKYSHLIDAMREVKSFFKGDDL